jgi:predicted DCC family thiol-disulfide oxidoreductase YuxK
MKLQRPIVFFDGVCGLCSEFIDFLFSVDKKEHFLVAALQGETAKQYLSEKQILDLDTVAVYDPKTQKILERSRAIFYVLRNVGGIWFVVSLFSVFPQFVTDFAYKIIAKYRYIIFGKKETCRMPTPSERARFLN